MKLGMSILLAFTAITAGLVLIATYMLITSGGANAQEATGLIAAMTDPEVRKWGYIAAAAATGLSAAGAGYAVAQVGSAAVGALAEKPELMGRVLVMVGLAEGVAIYGLIVAILILNQIG